MKKKILLTGATGYVGGRLVPQLLAQGHEVRCIVRNARRVQEYPWADQVEIFSGDLDDTTSVEQAMQGIDVAYFLVHSMSSNVGPDYQQHDLEIATRFRECAEKADAQQIIYLGGLGDENDPQMSKHLHSRIEIGKELARGSVPVTEFRAAVILGAGSASFELLRTIVEMLPAMVTPRWVTTPCQPIAIDDVLWYLTAAATTPEARGKVIEIGASDTTNYREMLQRYARLTGLRHRPIVTLPLLTPYLSSLWCGLVTPIPAPLARQLIQGLSTRVVVTNDLAMKLFDHQPQSVNDALRNATAALQSGSFGQTWKETDYSDTTPADPLPTDPDWAGPLLCEDKKVRVTSVSRDDLWKTVTGIGGRRGWFVSNQLWALRGLIDTIWGGVGSRRGRVDPDKLNKGDFLDFWRVEEVKENELLRLRAEMKLPGRAWLEWTLDTDAEGQSVLTQWARFFPTSLLGRMYWWSLVPVHHFIFGRLADAIVFRAKNKLYGDKVQGRKLPDTRG